MNQLLTVVRCSTLIAVAAVLLNMVGCTITSGDIAPDWTLQDTTGAPHSLSTYDGRVRVLEFWATWCAPCHAVSPHMQAIHDRFADRPVKVLAIHYNDVGDPQAYLSARGFSYTALIDGHAVAEAYGVSKIPTIIVVDRQGLVIHRQTGFNQGDERLIEEFIESAMNDQ